MVQLKVNIINMLIFKVKTYNLDCILSAVDSEKYIEKVAKRVVEILETRFITGPDLPIDDYTAYIK